MNPHSAANANSRPVPWKAVGIVLFSLLGGAGLVSLVRSDSPASRPNLVLIVVDTLRADAVSTNIDNPDTPNIAELASHGVVFSRAFAQAPLTLPAHMSMFSGLYPHESGVQNNAQEVPAEFPLLAEDLGAAGYATSAVVSLATLWPMAEGLGLDRGFEVFDQGRFELSTAENTLVRLSRALDRFEPSRPFFLYAHFSDPHEPYNEHKPWFVGTARGSSATASFDGQPLQGLSTSTMSYWETIIALAPGPHTFTLESEAAFELRTLECSVDGVEVQPHWISGARMTPTERVVLEFSGPDDDEAILSLRLWLNDVPTQREIRRRYASEVRAVDAAVGGLLRELKKRELWDNTLVVLTADHGEALGEHGAVGHAISLHDELLAVPLIIRLPGDRHDGGLEMRSESLVQQVDLVPTLHQALGLPLSQRTSGKSLFSASAPFLLSETHPPEAPRTLYAVRDETYKMIFDPLADEFKMYRLGPDPMELDNVFGHQGHLRKEWQSILRSLAHLPDSEIEPGAEMEPGSEVEPHEDVQNTLSALGY